MASTTQTAEPSIEELMNMSTKPEKPAEKPAPKPKK